MNPVILYEDNHILVSVKPQNIPSQADSSGDADFLSILKDSIKERYRKPGNVYLGLVHRLDRPAGGVMVFARTSKAAARLSRQMRSGEFEKRYYAVVTGNPNPADTLCDMLFKDRKTNVSKVVPGDFPGAKPARLSYVTRARSQKYSLLDISLQTGRAHQIRVQLSSRNLPIAGDKKYGDVPAAHLCLWAYSLSFNHPTEKERLTFTASPPDELPWLLFDL